MVFEVDNTTEQLIQELQAGIEDTIERLRTGQNDINTLIKDIKQAQQNFAQSGQIEELCHLLEGLSTDVRGKASAAQLQDTASQIEALVNRGNASQEAGLELLSDTKGLAENIIGSQGKMSNLLEKVRDVQDNTQEIATDIKASQEMMVQAITESIDSLLTKKLEPLSELENKISRLSELLSTQKDELLHTAQSAVETAQRNQSSLKAIIAYLSLPGYKRFFRGMEAESDAATE